MKATGMVAAWVLATVMLLATTALAIDDNMGAISPYGNMLMTMRLGSNLVGIASYEPDKAGILVILVDNNGWLNSRNPFGAPYLFLDLYIGSTDVFAAQPGGNWYYLTTIYD